LCARVRCGPRLHSRPPHGRARGLVHATPSWRGGARRPRRSRATTTAERGVSASASVLPRPSAFEWGGKNSNGLKDPRTENGSSQGQNLGLTGFCVPRWLYSGAPRLPIGARGPPGRGAPVPIIVPTIVPTIVPAIATPACLCGSASVLPCPRPWRAEPPPPCPPAPVRVPIACLPPRPSAHAPAWSGLQRQRGARAAGVLRRRGG